MGRKPSGGNLALLILAVLEEGPSHGYRIMRTLQERTGGQVPQSQGTLYVTLQALEERGLIRSSWSQGEGGRERRHCEITQAGIEHLAAMRAQQRRMHSALNWGVSES